MSFIETLRLDYARHGSSLRSMPFWAMATYRIGRWAGEQSGPLRIIGDKLYGGMLFVVEATSGILLNREVTIGENLHLVHSGNIKIHPACVIGNRVGIMHDVTLGEGERPGAPVIGDDVFIGTGARVLGPVKVGNRVRIAANSLVVTDLPDDCMAIGVPAKILRYTGRPSAATKPSSAP